MSVTSVLMAGDKRDTPPHSAALYVEWLEKQQHKITLYC